MRLLHRAAVAASLLALPAASAAAQGVFVSPAELQARRAAGHAVRLLDVGRSEVDLGRGRIAGAAVMQLAQVVATRDGIPNELRPVAELDELFESLGVGDSETVVVYGDPLAAARVWATLDLLGHPDVHLLDGGIARWRAEGRPLDGAAAHPPRASFTPRLRTERLVDAAWVHARLGDAHVLLLDARPPGEYAGTQQASLVPRPGHIPGARSLFWRRLLQSDSLPALRDRTELQRLFSVPEGAADVVAYCRTGVQASMLYAVARELALPVRLYDPSFADWSARGDLPVEQGEGLGSTR